MGGVKGMFLLCKSYGIGR